MQTDDYQNSCCSSSATRDHGADGGSPEPDRGASARQHQQSEASLTRNFYFIFDGSGSMSESLTKQCKGDKRFSSRLEGAKWAVEQFLPLVPRDVNLGLWIFDTNGNSERVPLGPDNRGQFLTEVKKTRAGGKTPLTESIEQGVNRLVQQRDTTARLRGVSSHRGHRRGGDWPSAPTGSRLRPRATHPDLHDRAVSRRPTTSSGSTPCPIVLPIRSKPSSAVSRKRWRRPTCSILKRFLGGRTPLYPILLEVGLTPVG